MGCRSLIWSNPILSVFAMSFAALSAMLLVFASVLLHVYVPDLCEEVTAGF
jgi:hypothetical protein